MSSTIWMLLAAAGVMAASCAATGLVLPLLRRRAVLDHPNERSSHAVPTPRGGGIAVVVVLLAAWGASAMQTPQPGLWIVLAAAAGLAAVSWIDDLGSLPAAPRLAAQALAVAAAVPFLAAQGPVFQGLLPNWLDAAAAAFAWLWFINLFNFMDGIDGISGVEAFSIGAGVMLLALPMPGAGPPASLFLGASIAAAAAGFLWWNWHPAKVFLGDVGSVPLGFLLGWLLLGLAAAGDWAAALILPLYYLADATITLGCRALRREKIWQAHREHFYQRAVQRGRSHATVSRAVFGVNACLAALALASLTAPWMALVAAALVVAGLLAWMAR